MVKNTPFTNLLWHVHYSYVMTLLSVRSRMIKMYFNANSGSSVFRIHAIIIISASFFSTAEK
jgi:hypothetical protein